MTFTVLAVLLSVEAAAVPMEERLDVPFLGMELVRDPEGRILIDKVSPSGPGRSVPPGARLLRAQVQERKPGAELSGMGLRDVYSALVGPHGTRVTLELEVGGQPRSVEVTCEYSLPAEPPSKDARWDAIRAQQNLVAAEARARIPPRTRTDTVDLRLDLARVEVGDGVVRPAEGTAATTEWIVTKGEASGSCDGEDVATLEVTDGVGVRISERWLDVYAWRVPDVLHACAQGKDRLDSGEIIVTLRCRSGKQTIRRRRIPLAVTCLAGPPPEPELDFGTSQTNATPARLVAGEETVVKIHTFMPGAVSPRISRLRVVQVDRQGKIARAFPPYLDWSSRFDPRDAPEPSVTLRARQGDVVRLAVEAEFRDGTKVMQQPIELRVGTRAEFEEADARFRKSLDADEALRQKLERQWPDPCKDRREVVEWLNAQPEVRGAVLQLGGLSFVGPSGTSMIIGCSL